MCSATIITSVDRVRGTSGDRPIIGAFDGDTDPLLGTLAVGEYVFSDREYLWDDVAAGLAGAEQVLTFNTDKDSNAWLVMYIVEVSQSATLALTVDDRIPDEWGLVGSQQEAVDLAARSFLPGTFTDSGMDVVIGEGGGRVMSVFTADVDAGTYVFGAQPSSKNFYSIIAIPEPATLMLLGLGGLLLRKRR
jgi:hypothetical protein